VVPFPRGGSVMGVGSGVGSALRVPLFGCSGGVVIVGPGTLVIVSVPFPTGSIVVVPGSIGVSVGPAGGVEVIGSGVGVGSSIGDVTLAVIEMSGTEMVSDTDGTLEVTGSTSGRVVLTVTGGSGRSDEVADKMSEIISPSPFEEVVSGSAVGAGEEVTPPSDALTLGSGARVLVGSRRVRMGSSRPDLLADAEVVGSSTGSFVGDETGAEVGSSTGSFVGDETGAEVGSSTGSFVGVEMGSDVASSGILDGVFVGASVELSGAGFEVVVTGALEVSSSGVEVGIGEDDGVEVGSNSLRIEEISTTGAFDVVVGSSGVEVLSGIAVDPPPGPVKVTPSSWDVGSSSAADVEGVVSAGGDKIPPGPKRIPPDELEGAVVVSGAVDSGVVSLGVVGVG